MEDKNLDIGLSPLKLGCLAIPLYFLVMGTTIYLHNSIINKNFNYNKWSEIREQRINELEKEILYSNTRKFNESDINNNKVLDFNEFLCYNLKQNYKGLEDRKAKRNLFKEYCN